MIQKKCKQGRSGRIFHPVMASKTLSLSVNANNMKYGYQLACQDMGTVPGSFGPLNLCEISSSPAQLVGYDLPQTHPRNFPMIFRKTSFVE